ncbi:glycosyltransferase [Sphingobium limneticum]|uniref:glycosyltransferase family 2 protein n=1 Tax=Sphingobium limneticum TaxID=1007511 RepID=UPI00123DBE6C|nr:glycosyltransferase [Sphingobium limneticum]KAA9009626.1 glycosyltransferase [Sphingobium limneticum]
MFSEVPVFLSFQLDSVRFPGIACLLERQKLPPAGGIEEKFLDGAEAFTKQASADFLPSLAEVVKLPSIKWVLVSRNAATIVDEYLLDRLETLLGRIVEHNDKVTIVTGGGLGLNDERYCANYSSTEPFIFYNPDLHPIIDTMIDLYLVSADDVRDYIRDNGVSNGEVFELALIATSYAKKGKFSLYSPDLSTGVNGPFRSRNLSLMAEQAGDLAEPLTSDKVLSTLAGPLTLAYKPKCDTLGRPVPSHLRTLIDAAENVIEPLLDGPMISIVTRTQFRRMYLLRRMLTSISRARIQSLPVEIMLSTDIDANDAAKHLDSIRQEFPRLDINLTVNRRSEHSRVANLLGGVEAAKGEYIWFMDDDDYVDLFAFKNIASAFFCGARPFILGDSIVHTERWDKINEAFPILAESSYRAEYPGLNWRSMFAGVNHLPICGPVIPREFLLRRVSEFRFDYDLSEDYTLFLLLLSAPDLPPVVNLSKVIAHISIREGDDNSVTAPDRTGWTRDISAYLYSLFYGSASQGASCWSSLLKQHIVPVSKDTQEQIIQFQAALSRKDGQILQMSREIEYLQNLVKSQVVETTAA